MRFRGLLGGVFTHIGQPERSVEWCRAQLASGRDASRIDQGSLVIAKTMAGSDDDAMAAARGLIEAAEATRNPLVLSFALCVYGLALL